MSPPFITLTQTGGHGLRVRFMTAQVIHWWANKEGGSYIQTNNPDPTDTGWTVNESPEVIDSLISGALS